MQHKALSDVMTIFFCNFQIFPPSDCRLLFTIHCKNSILIVLLMSICITVLLVWISVNMFKPYIGGLYPSPLQRAKAFLFSLCLLHSKKY